ncbi:helix-turn-helix domain-containing protein [Gottfriedia acidiceleris]|uniref:helix-turn-helix domain-containing protein n=1 Tax=Gottfriedia acidiceleris TaxID=371036 RepID=UPI003D1E57C3
MFSNYDDIISIEDLMEILNIGRNKAYELLQSGEIGSFKIGKAYRIPKKCIQKYVVDKIQSRIHL